MASIDTDGGVVFGDILRAARQALVISERKELAAERVRRFQTDQRGEAMNASNRQRPGDPADRLRRILENAIASPWATAEETAVFQHALDVLTDDT